MAARITAHLHELVFAMDRYADQVLTGRFGVDYNLFVFLNPLLERTLDVTGLAASLNLTKAAVSKRVPVLQREGWIETFSDPANARRVMIKLTAQGDILVSEAGEVLGRRFELVLGEASVDAERLDHDLVSVIKAVRALGEAEPS